VTLKDMRSGNQSEIALGQLVTGVKSALPA
jgi:hypothetical protein